MNQTKSFKKLTHLSVVTGDCWWRGRLCNNILCMVSCCPLFIVILWRMPAGPACDSFIGSSRWAGASLDISGSRDQSGIQHYSLLLAIRTHRASYWHYQDCLGSYLMIHDASPNIYRFLFLYLEFVRWYISMFLPSKTACHDRAELSLLIGKCCHRSLWLASPAWLQGGAVNLSQMSQLRPRSITHSVLGLHSIVRVSTIVFTDSGPDPAPASHARLTMTLWSDPLPPTKKHN